MKSNSFFLFGARGTGKSTFLQSQFKPSHATLRIDLLDPEMEDRYARRPKLLEQEILAMNPSPEWVIIDEVQKVPKLLNLAHRLIEKTKIRFVLTGSSARKLKRGAANLLAGRAFVYRLFPFTARELGDRFELDSALRWGTLPKIFSLSESEEKTAYLKSYALTYLKEEIQAEQLVRNLDPFRAFLEVAAQSNGKIVNSARIAREVGVDIKTVQTYFQILEETWVGFFLPSYHRSVRKSQRSHPKFYLFDPGVKRALERSLGSAVESGNSAYGEAFEHWVILEFQRMNEYLGADYRLSHFRTKDGAEIDLILDRPKTPTILIEIKSGERIDETEARKLDRLTEAFPGARSYLLSRDPVRRKIGSTLCAHWRDGIEEIFRS